MRAGLTAKLLGPWLIFILLIAAGLLAFKAYSGAVEDRIAAYNARHQRALELTKDIMLRTQDRWMLTLEYQVSPSPDLLHELENSETSLKSLIAGLEAESQGESAEADYSGNLHDRPVLENFKLAREGLTLIYIEFAHAVDAHDPGRQRQVIEKLARKMRSVHAALDDLMQYHIVSQRVAMQYSRDTLRHLSLMFFGAAVLLLAAMVGFTVYQAKSIVGPLRNLTHHIESFDVMHPAVLPLPSMERGDEIGVLARSFFAMMEQLKAHVAELSKRQTEILRQMGEIAHIGGWELQLNPEKLTWTDEVYRIHEIGVSEPPAVADAINFYAPEARPRIRAALDLALQTGQPWDMELPFVTAKGRQIWVRTLGAGTLKEGKVVRLNGTFQDITARKLATDAIVQANADLESFSYSVSHDLRTPLRAIDGFSRILLEDYGDKLDEEGRRLLGVVRANTERMSTLIDDILHFSRAGRVELKKGEVDMRALAVQVADELGAVIARQQTEIIIGELPSIQGDKGLLHQVVENLLSNAVKFSAQAAHPRVHVDGWQNGDEVICCVHDNGVGFDMRYAEKLFGVFQRLHGIDEFEGTGIGLAIVKRIVNRHGGRVWAEAELGQGAAFYFSLPNKRATS